MAIDGIGKKGPAVPPAPPAPAAAGNPSRAAEVGRKFEVPKAGSAQAPAPVEPARTALDRLRSGEIDVEGYLDSKVADATSHLGALPAARLAEIRAALRDRVVSDPTLADLVRAATGKAPPPPGDD